MPAIRPQLLTIGAHRVRPTHIRPRHTPTLLAGYDAALRLLDHAQPIHPTLILLDLQAEEPGFPEFAAPQLAAVLTQRMQRGTIHPAWLIGLLFDPSPDLDAEAQVAGCQFIVHSPITREQWPGVLRLGETAAPVPPSDRATHAYQLAAERVLHAVQAVRIPLWTAEDVLVLLGALTRYPVEPPPRGVGRVLRALGGARAASQRLHTIADSWRTRHPLSAEILWLVLDGWERREIVSYFVSRHLYEDSRIYACIKRLPERIAQELRISQGREEH